MWAGAMDAVSSSLPPVLLVAICVSIPLSVRMAADPRRSVLNPDNRAHDVNNLYMLDGASFAPYKRRNPTLTVSAVSQRAANIWPGR